MRLKILILAIVAIVAIVATSHIAKIAKKKETPAPAETGQAGQTPQPSQPQPSLSLEDGLRAHKMIQEVIESDLERIRTETQARQAEALAIAKAIQEYSDSRIEKIEKILEALKEKEPIERGVSSSTPPAGGQINIYINGKTKNERKATEQYRTPLPYPRTGGWSYSWGYKRYPQQRYPQPKQTYPVPDPDSGPETPRTKHSRRQIGGEVARIGLDFAQQFAYGWALTGKPGRSAGAAAINVGAAAARRRAGI